MHTKNSQIEKLLKGLNDKQKQAVEAPVGPTLVVAGAGSGKTKVLAHRIAFLVATGIKPENILAITFTNKAAGEMRERVSHLIQEQGVRSASETPASQSAWQTGTPWIGTFHGLAATLLRREANHVGMTKNFTILDERDAKDLFKAVITDLGLDPKQFQPAHIRSAISKFQSELTKPDDFLSENDHPFAQKLYTIWVEYERRMKKMNAIDFDHLLTVLVDMLKNQPEILEKYRNRWHHVHIDEYQDTNYPQYTIAKLLACPNKKMSPADPSIFVVGDIDQAIYSWRGADFRNMLNFELDFPNATTITLEENYRSTQIILEAANTVIEKNTLRKPKTLFTKKRGGEVIQLIEAENEQQEAEMIAYKIQELMDGAVAPQEIAIMYRTNAQSRALEEALLQHGIAYHVAGVRFYERKEIKDILAYVRLSLNTDDMLSLKRAIATPPRGIGKVLLKKYTQYKKENDPNIFTQREKEKIDTFEQLMKEMTHALHTKKTHDALSFVVKKSGIKNLMDAKTDPQEERQLNVQELLAISKKFDRLAPPEGLIIFLEEITLMTQADTTNKDKKAVQLLTTHAAKGLEFKVVFVTGLEDGLFPLHGFNEGQKGVEKQEEERRLYYVALTRAQELLFLSFAKQRMLFGERAITGPSPFISEIPEHLIAMPENEF